MTSPQLDEEAIFHIARNIPDSAIRAAYLNQICAGDLALRERVEALLQVHEQDESFLKPANPASTAAQAEVLERPGGTIDRYKLMEQVGEGGMGIVFVAQQERPIRRKVALKVIKPGMDSEAVVARFEAERQALAMMDHPNIAKVLDAGTTETGRPYFVMELVNGVPITEYCDKNKLAIPDRLDLFIQVCQAIQHAHQKGIIHRDIKPSNVLVTLHDGKPVPKVIDFGVAKALNARLTDRTIYTGQMQIVGTLLYMSPEQAELSGLDIDTRSDIYALGVLLYELLTGQTPFESKRLHEAAWQEACRIIREEDPPKPSVRISSLGETLTAVSGHRRADPRSLPRLVRGDLDWIVMKALEKDRTRRYEAAIGLAKDVERYLNDESVVARPPSMSYQFRKFAKRNRAALVALVLVGVSLVGGTSIALWQAHVARQEASRANEILGRLNQSLFDQGLTDVFSGKQPAANRIIEQLRSQGDTDLADELANFALFFSGPNIDRVSELVCAASDRHPEDPGVFALMLLGHLGRGDYRAYAEARPKLEVMLKRALPLSAPDLFFVASCGALEPKSRLEYASRAFEKSPSPVPLLYMGRERSDYALYTGDTEEALRAVEEVQSARVFLRDAIAVRLQGLATYLVAANAMKANGKDESRILAKADELTAMLPKTRELLRWERFFLAEYYHEKGQKSDAAALLDGEPRGGWRDYETYLLLALAYELGTSHDKFARGEHVGPFATGGMVLSAGLRGKNEDAGPVWTFLQKENRVPEVVTLGLDALLVSGAARDEVERCAAAKRRTLNPEGLDWRGRAIVEHVLPLYVRGSDGDAALRWAATSEYPKLWLTYVHWVLGMRSLAENDYAAAKEHFENVCKHRVFYLGQYLWARAMLANWDELVAVRNAAAARRKPILP